MTTPAQQQPYVHVPDTVSPQAQAFLRTLRDPALKPAFPEPDDLAGWEKMQAFAEADGKAKSAPLGFPPTLIQDGLKETLLSGFVQLYQALDVAGVPVKLDEAWS